MSFDEWLDQMYFDKLTDDDYYKMRIVWLEAQEQQRHLCVKAIQNCKLVEPNVKRIRLYEAIGECIEVVE